MPTTVEKVKEGTIKDVILFETFVNSLINAIFCGKLLIYLSNNMAVQRTQEVTKITFMSIDHLETTTSTRASRMCAAVIAPPSRNAHDAAIFPTCLSTT